jgi:hypothetical protein
MVRAVEKVRDRLLRAAAALEKAGIPYAVIGGNAVAVWVGMVDRGAVRNTRDVDLLLRRGDLAMATPALEAAGFVAAKSFGVTMFLDGPDAKPSESLHIIFAGEKVQNDYTAAAPDVTAAERPTSAPCASDSSQRCSLISWNSSASGSLARSSGGTSASVP